ncbi:MAG TPA: hypothetical protein VHJ83_10620, partial [Micromonosporaceae bacterium]|nr:hypothetical protein [Micromonosporaceae bacterium]
TTSWPSTPISTYLEPPLGAGQGIHIAPMFRGGLLQPSARAGPAGDEDRPTMPDVAILPM